MEIGHKDRRGIFVAEKDRDDLLSKLGENILTRKHFWIVDILGISGEDALNDYEATFAPDGHIRTALTLQEDEAQKQVKGLNLIFDVTIWYILYHMNYRVWIHFVWSVWYGP